MHGPSGLTRWERAVFAAAARAVSDVEAGDAALAAALDPVLRRIASVERRKLSLLLWGLEWLVPLLARRRGRFSRLPRATRRALLEGGAASPLKPVRQGAAALRSLAMLACYGRESAWEALGYDGPWIGRVAVPVLPAPALPVLAATDDAVVRAQVCVVGAGAGGAAATARLAELGLDVVTIEAGAARTPDEYDQRELSMLPLLYQEAGLRATADTAIGILQGEGVGGSTLHNTGLVYAPPSGVVARWRAEHGFAVDDEELDRNVAAVREALRATPIPESGINRANGVLREGAERLGWRYRIAHHNRAPCSGCGYCMLGCAYNRKHNAALSFLPTAVEQGARILTGARAVRIEGEAGRRRVVCERLDALGRPTGPPLRVEARVVVLAAGALETPALLLRSGLGNRRVGRGLRLHPAAAVAAIFPDPVVAWRGVPQAVIVEEFAEYLERGRGGFLFIPSAATSPALTAVLTPGAGPEHRRRMLAYPRMASASVLLHDETAGRVTASRGGRPIARYWPSAADRAELRRGIEALARLYLAAGAERVLPPFAGSAAVTDEASLARELSRARTRPFTLPLNSVHPQASCALGADPARSAVDPRGEVWGAPGVFVCDASIFPTSVGVPPQVTIMALARVVADRIRQEVA